MLAMIAVPAAITVKTIRSPSLLVFAVPAVIILLWFLRAENATITHWASWWNIAVFVPLGFTLDFVFINLGSRLANRFALLMLRHPSQRFLRTNIVFFYAKSIGAVTARSQWP